MPSEYTDKQLAQMIAVRKRRAPKYLAVVDQSGCTGCEVCIVFCPADCIYWAPEGNGVNPVVEINYDLCIGCTLCSENCPWNTIFRWPFEDVMKVKDELTLRHAKDNLVTFKPAGRGMEGEPDEDKGPSAPTTRPNNPTKEKIPT
jgi:formate hydrogenlyase subunit 6/NADH:ubiquinone oxidoreductase subunit I